MRMSLPRTTTLLHLLLGLRTASTTTTTSTSTSTSISRHLQFQIHPYCPATNLLLHTPGHKYSTSTSTSTSTMSPEPETNQQTPQNPTSNEQTEEQEEAKPLLSLPPIEEDSADSVRKLDVNGSGVKLDHLGPLIVNQDGTLSRIGNWAQMTEVERRNTLRILGKRNKARMEALKKAGGEDGAVSQGE